MRTYEEIRDEINAAHSIGDIGTMRTLAQEISGLYTPIAEATASNTLGNVHLSSGDYSEALGCFRRALTGYVECGNTLGVAGAHCNIGHALFYGGDYADSLSHYRLAVDLCDQVGNTLFLANTLSGMGNVYLRTGDFPAALEHFRRAVDLYELIGQRGGVASVTQMIATVYLATGDYPSALECYHRAMTVYEELGDSIGIAKAYGNMGILYRRTRDYTSAMKYLQLSLELDTDLGRIASTANVLGNIGIVCFNTGDHQSAIDHYRRSLSLHAELGNLHATAAVTGNLIEALLAANQDAEAEQLLESQAAMRLDDPAIRARHFSNWAVLAERSQNLDDAKIHLQHALEIVETSGLRLEAAEYHERLRDLAKKCNDFEGYIHHNDQFSRITEEIRGKEATQKMAMMEAERKMEKERTEHQKHLAVLHSTLPKHIADRVARGEVVNDHYDNASVIFLDIVGFTTLSDQLSSEQVVQLLEQIFTTLDAVCERHDVVKIKTIGDSYMAVAFPSESSSSEQRAASAALDMLHEISHVVSPASSPEGSPEGSPLQVRIGMHSGAVTAGIIGTTRMQYDVWGDTVNVASRMESTSLPGRIHVSSSFALALKGEMAKERKGEREKEQKGDGLSSQFPVPCSLIERGETELKGKGLMTTYWLDGILGT